MSNLQQTIKSPFSFSGKGLHCGEEAKITILPAEPNSGINFRVTDLSPALAIPANIRYAEKQPNKTSLKKEGITIDTIEHLMAAAYSLGLDNLLIEISGREVPILDGSALPFVEAFKSTGIATLAFPKKVYKVHTPVTLENDSGESLLVLAPLDRLRISFVLEWPVFGSQFFSYDSDRHDFEKEIAPARTFGLVEDLEKLHSSGLAKGASLENALGIDKNGYVNTPRFKNEPVRHKILDLMGDLALLGAKISGHIIAINSGHTLNLELVERLEVIYG